VAALESSNTEPPKGPCFARGEMRRRSEARRQHDASFGLTSAGYCGSAERTTAARLKANAVSGEILPLAILPTRSSSASATDHSDLDVTKAIPLSKPASALFLAAAAPRRRRRRECLKLPVSIAAINAEGLYADKHNNTRSTMRVVRSDTTPQDMLAEAEVTGLTALASSDGSSDELARQATGYEESARTSPGPPTPLALASEPHFSVKCGKLPAEEAVHTPRRRRECLKLPVSIAAINAEARLTPEKGLPCPVLVNVRAVSPSPPVSPLIEPSAPAVQLA